MHHKKFFPCKYTFIITPAIFIIFVVTCYLNPHIAEWYMQHCYPFIATVLSFISGWLPFSLLDLLIATAIAATVLSLWMLFSHRLRFRKWLFITATSLLWIVTWFYMAWGIGYFRPDFHTRFNIGQPGEDKKKFENYVIRHIDSLNKAYTTDTSLCKKDIDIAIEESYQSYSHRIRIPYPCGKRLTKYTFMEKLMTKMGVAGYFDPFFNEVHVNNFLLPISYPFTLAHEKAHQFGITSEAECNLFASIICTASEYPLVKYSGYLQTVSYLLGNLRKISPDEYPEIVSMISPQILQDYQRIRNHWMGAINPQLSSLQDKVYDSYLKTNKQQSGIQSYSEMVGLLLTWEEILSEPDR